MNAILSEKEYQNYILERLSENGYEITTSASYDRFFAIDREALFRFLNTTQPDEMDALRKVYKSDLENTIIGVISTEETKTRGSRLDVLKHGIEIANHKLELMYTKPAPHSIICLISYMSRIFFPCQKKSGQATRKG